MSENKIPILYAPFQEIVQKHNLTDVFYYTWALTNNLQFNIPLPSRIPGSQNLNAINDISVRRYNSVNEWELEFILTEAIIHWSQPPLKSMLNSTDLAEIINACRDLFTSINDSVPRDKESMFQEFFRMSHHQFGWQYPLDLPSIYRYFRLFNHSEVNLIFEKVFGLRPFEYFIIALTTCGLYQKNFFLKMPIEVQLPNITNEQYGRFLKKYSLNIGTLKEEIRKHKKYDDGMFYGYDPMRKTPLIEVDDKIFCPFVTLLFWQVTNGIFYHLIAEHNFDNGIGHSLEDYTGYIIKKANVPQRLTIHPESVYNNGMNRTSDWIIEDDSSLVFYECKAKRITLAAKTELDFTLGAEKDIDTIAKYVVQVYKTFLDYKGGKYKDFPYRSNKKHYLHIISLEEWYLSFNIVLWSERLNEEVIKRLHENSIDVSIISEVPYFNSCIAGFERDIQVIHKIGIKDYYENLKNNTINKVSGSVQIRNLTKEDFYDEFYARAVSN